MATFSHSSVFLHQRDAHPQEIKQVTLLAFLSPFNSLVRAVVVSVSYTTEVVPTKGSTDIRVLITTAFSDLTLVIARLNYVTRSVADSTNSVAHTV